MSPQHENGAGLSGYASWKSKSEALDFRSARSLKRKLLADLSTSHQQGRPLRPEELLTRWPSPAEADTDAAGLLLADYYQRCSRGEAVDFDEYASRFPEHREALLQLFHQYERGRTQRLASGSFRIQFALPSVGDEVFGFRLWHQLGAGAFARVFLAEQVHLAGRPVVVKISDQPDDEPETLAQLQHTHIVPIHSVHSDADSGLRAVCMPYFGGASLTAVLQELALDTSRPTRGERLLQALERVQAPTLDAVKEKQTSGATVVPADLLPATHTPRQLLRGQDYFQAVVWLVARLAEGLQHAHDRGIFHRDIKPSNILLTADAQPMLLDFNLSFQHLDHQGQISLGGTVAYMAPEHLRAFRTGNYELARRVDHRADIYSLGLVLFEMLAGEEASRSKDGQPPLRTRAEALAEERSRAAPSVRQRRPDVPWSLESVVRKCLAPEPEQRYQQAEDLAEDLRRFLDDRPLRHAPELSWAERTRKWLRRHPRVTSSGSVAIAAAVLLAAAGAALVGVRAHLAATQADLEAKLRQHDMQAYQDGTVRALMLVNADTDLQDHLKEGLATCENTLGVYGILDRDNWQTPPDWQWLSAENRQQLAENTRELLLVLAWARVRLAPKDSAGLHDALALVDRAESVSGLAPSPALWLERASYRRLLGDSAGAELAQQEGANLRPGSPRDYYLLATTYIRTNVPNSHARAVGALGRSIELNPRYFWAWFQRGVCYLRSGEYQLAAADFGTCVGMWPELAWAHFNLGYAHEKSRQLEPAFRAYSAALDRDAEFVDAYLNRGMVLLELRRHADALRDFDRAIKLRPEDPALDAGRGLALEHLGKPAEADAAFHAAFARLGTVPETVQNRIRVGYAFVVRQRLPVEARAALDAVLERAPKHAEALYGRALLAIEQDQTEDAIGWLDRCIAASPQWPEPRRHRAIQLARAGRFDEAFRAIDDCLDSGATHYAAACVAARAAAGPSKGAVERALDHLRQAFDQGYGREIAETDTDLALLRKNPEFQRLLRTKGGPSEE